MHQWRRQIEANKSICHVVERVTKRRALIEWAKNTNLISWYNSILQARLLIVHRRILEKSLHSWREVTRASLDLRQKYFLMMIFNRWKYYTDECIDLRQMRYVALIHWAAVKCKKSFAALKLNAKKNKEANAATSFNQSNYGRSAFTRYTSTPYHSRNTFMQHGLSPADYLVSNISPSAIDGRGQSYDNTARKDAMFQNDIVRGSLPGSTSPPSFLRRSNPYHNLFSLHALGDVANRGRKYSENSTSPNYRTSISREWHTPVVAGMLQGTSHYLNLNRSRHFVARTEPSQHTTRCFDEFDVYIPTRRPALRSTNDFVVANMLDEMISKVERRNLGYHRNE